MRIAPIALLVLACGSGESTAERPPASAPAPERACRPLVSGCGCAYACALAVEALGGGRHRVLHDLQDSRLDEVVEARFCFDAAGRGHPEASARAPRCLEVFHDGTGCGGECIPTTAYLHCALEGESCVPSAPEGATAYVTIAFSATDDCAGGVVTVDGVVAGRYPVQDLPVAAGRRVLGITSDGDCAGYGRFAIDLADGARVTIDPARFR